MLNDPKETEDAMIFTTDMINVLRDMQNILKISPPKIERFQIKILNIFIFLLKHRLWVLVRTASPRRFSRVPTIYFLSRNKKNNVYPCKPQFYYIKMKFKLSQFYRHVFVMQ